MIMVCLGGDGDSDPKPMEPQWQIDMRKRLANTAEPTAQSFLGSLGDPYKGQLTAPQSGFQTQAFQNAENYFSSPMAKDSSLYKSGQGEIEKVLSGEYNPEDSLYYQSFRNALTRELQRSQDQLANRSSSRDQFFGGGRLDQERELQEGGLNTIGQVLGNLQNIERQRMFAAAPMAVQMAQQNTMEPFNRIQQQLGIGSMERAIQQEILNAQLQEFMRQRGEMGQALSTAQGLATYQPPYYMPQETGGIGDLLMGSVLGNMGEEFGGILGQKSGNWFGGLF
jgi:hypothetical protein